MNEATLHKPCVLVLNRNWQAINVRTPEMAFCQMFADVATGLDIDGENMTPVKWDAWSKLPIRDQDDFIQTTRGNIRVPTVIVLASYNRVPTSKPKFTSGGIHRRDEYTCQYCAEVFPLSKLNVDHVIPRAKGGKSSWDNLVCSCIPCNTKKADRLPHEAGMIPKRKPFAPKEVIVTSRLHNSLGIADWNHFLVPGRS